MMEFRLDQAIALLGRTPGVLSAMLDGLDDDWVQANRGEGTFSPFDVVGHLIHGERTDWIPRTKHILKDGDARPFEPFDRFAQFDENRGKTLAELLATFAKLRSDNVRALRDLNLSEQDLVRRGTHPDFGTVTIRQLLSTWVVHDLNHLMQINRTLAAQYVHNVGPWRAYLSILKDS